MNRVINFLRNVLLLLLNWRWREDKVARAIEERTHKQSTPIVWAYHCKGEFGLDRMPTYEELQVIHGYCGADYVDFLYRDMKDKGRSLI